jgi:hypothetical protein
MYQLTQINRDNKITSVARNDGWHIPFDPANTDYQTFKTDLTNGVELNDAEGTPMTVEQITTFLQGLA